MIIAIISCRHSVDGTVILYLHVLFTENLHLPIGRYIPRLNLCILPELLLQVITTRVLISCAHVLRIRTPLTLTGRILWVVWMLLRVRPTMHVDILRRLKPKKYASVLLRVAAASLIFQCNNYIRTRILMARSYSFLSRDPIARFKIIF